MEDKQLDFNQPLLSVRRHAPMATSQRSEKRKINNSRPLIPRLPPYRSELKSGPISNPGAVPFLWEQSPGQPKEEIKPQTRNSDRPPIAPKLPPGRYPKADPQDCHKVSKGTIVCKNQVVDLPRSSDNKRQDVDVPCDSRTDPSYDENVKNFERSNETMDEKEISDSEDSDEAYVDALDTLSRAESSFLNCSMSGLSGLDALDAKPSGNFSTDLQAREFMMDRFLPAAKAMASETPQYAPKKHAVPQQHPQEPKKTVNQYKPSLRYGPSFADRYSHYHDNEEEESDDEYDQRQSLPAVCGLLPRFCLKSSLCLLNPVPAMSVRTRVPMSSTNKVRLGSSLAGSFRESENKQSRSDRTEPKSIDNFQTAELDQDNVKLRNVSGRSESNSTSTYRDITLPSLEEKEVLSIPEEKMDAGIQGFGLHSKGFKTFQEFLDDQESPDEPNSGDPIIEKTLYVDTVQMVESPNLRSFSPKTQDTDGVPSSREEDHEIITKRIDQMHAIDSSLEDLKRLNTIDGDETLLPNAHKLDDANSLPLIDKYTKKPGMEILQGFRENQDINLVSTNKEYIEVTEQEAQESLEKQLSKAATLENLHQDYIGLPAPPALPKSPSDSWLWRTLPSMSTRSSLRTYLGAATDPENQCKKAPTIDMKWETIVKATTVQHRHLHYSEDLLTTIPET